MTSLARHPWRAAGIGAAANVVSVLPLFLVGATAVQMGADLGFGAAGLGSAVAMFWLANAVTSVPLGRLTDRLGAIWSLRAGAVIALVYALGISLASTRWWHLTAWLMLGGCSHAVGHPATNRLIVHVVPSHRLGTAFGLKGVAPPAAAMLAGLSVPAVALTLGWRWAFAGAAVCALPIMLAAGRRPPAPQRVTTTGPRPPLRDPLRVVALAGAFGLATAASTTVSAFFVDASVAAGSAPEHAGAMLALGSLGAVLTRGGSGAVADRLAGGHFRLCAAMLAVGTVGLALLLSARPGAMAVGVVLALMGTWGFNAVFWFALIGHYRDVPGRITGAVQPGAAIGGIVGPLVMGLLAEAFGYRIAWGFPLAITVLAATAVFLLGRRLDAPRRAASGGPEAAGG